MNFELIDNCFQIAVLLCAALAAIAAEIRHKDRRFLILALFFACVSMGTLYWVLHIFIFGNVPQVFYVSEVSWLAAYLFLLSLQMVRTDQVRPFFPCRPCPVPYLRRRLFWCFRFSVRPFCFFGICRGCVCDCISHGLPAPAQKRRTADRLLAAALRGTAASAVCSVRFYGGVYPL